MIGTLLAQPWLLVTAGPFFGAALAMLIPHARLSWIAALAVIGAVGVVAVDASLRAPLHAADGGSMFSAPLIAASATLSLFGGGAALRQLNPSAAPFAVALALCAAGGWMLALLARDWIAFAVAIELAWLAGAGVVAMDQSSRGALNGAFRMIVSGGVSASLMFLGVGFVVHATSSVDIAALTGATNAELCSVGIALIIVSLGAKAALAPLHPWSGAVFGRTGALPSLMIGAVGVVGALASIIRVGAGAAAAPMLAPAVEAVVAALGATSIVIGSVQAMGASNVRRLAAYAFASQAGCVLLGVSLGSPAGFAAALVQLFALTAAMLALLGAEAATRDASFEALDGLGRRNPLAGLAVTAGALSLMGAPLTIGFLGRWRLIEAAVGAGWWWVAGIALFASLAAVFYGGRLIERVYFRRAATVIQKTDDPWRSLLVLPLAASIVAIGIGVDPSFLLDASSRAAAHMFGVAP